MCECVCGGHSVCKPLTMLSLCSTAVTHTFPLIRCCYVGFIITATYRRNGFSTNRSVLLCLCIFLLCSNSFVSVSCHFVPILCCLISLSHCEDSRVLCNSSLGWLMSSYCVQAFVMCWEKRRWYFHLQWKKAKPCAHTQMSYNIYASVSIYNMYVLQLPQTNPHLLSSSLLSFPFPSSPPPYGTLQYC